MDGEWRKSSKSGPNGGSCVEVRLLEGNVQVRDSKDPEGPILVIRLDEWRAFIDGVKEGKVDL